MQIKYHAGPHIRSTRSTKIIMLELTAALLIVYLFSFFHYIKMGGAYARQIILIPVTAVGVCVLTECAYALYYKKEVLKYLKCSFPWITGLILALTVQINTSLYALAVSGFIAIFFGKLVYGGFGDNLFNPAAVGRVALLTGFTSNRLLDVVASPTPTTLIADNGWLLSSEGMKVFLNQFGGLKALFTGNYFGAIGETNTLLIIILCLILSYNEIFDWAVPFIYMGTILLGTGIVGLIKGVGIEFGIFNVLTGGVAFGAVFMLTDPVTNPNTRAGRIVFACFAAFFTVLIRYKASLPEGVCYSILLSNILTPAIEKFFDGKTMDRMHKDTLTVLMIMILTVIGIILISLSLSVRDYAPTLSLITKITGGRLL